MRKNSHAMTNPASTEIANSLYFLHIQSTFTSSSQSCFHCSIPPLTLKPVGRIYAKAYKARHSRRAHIIVILHPHHPKYWKCWRWKGSKKSGENVNFNPCHSTLKHSTFHYSTLQPYENETYTYFSIVAAAIRPRGWSMYLSPKYCRV